MTQICAKLNRLNVKELSLIRSASVISLFLKNSQYRKDFLKIRHLINSSFPEDVEEVKVLNFHLGHLNLTFLYLHLIPYVLYFSTNLKIDKIKI